MKRTKRLCVVVLAGCVATRPAAAQFIDSYFPRNEPGFAPLSQSVLESPRLGYEPLGIQIGSSVVQPALNSSVGYNSNVTGAAGGPGSVTVSNSGGVAIRTDSAPASSYADVSVDDVRYLAADRQSYTNAFASVGGVYNLGLDQASLGYSHLILNQLPQQIGSANLTAPLPYTVDDLRLSFSTPRGPFSFVPGVEVQYYQYGSATGVSDQAYRDRIYMRPQLTTVYSVSPGMDLLFVLRGDVTDYLNPQPNNQDRGSSGGAVLAGMDFAADAVLRYRGLIGFQYRKFNSSAFNNQQAVIFDGSVIWTPTQLTTVTGSLTRAAEDASQELFSAYTYSVGRLDIDHELRRNLVVSTYGSAEYAQYQQNLKNQTLIGAGANINWWLNRNVRLGASYDFSTRNAGQQASYSNNQILLHLSFSL